MEYAQDIIIQNEGKVMEKEVMIVRQQPSRQSYISAQCDGSSG